MLNLQKLIQELRRQKAKYWAKVLSNDAIYANWLRSVDTEDILPWYVWLYVPSLNLSSLGLALLFGLDPIDLEPVNIDFSAYLPSIDEFLQGILVDIQRLDLSKEFEWLKNLIDYIYENIEDVFADSLVQSLYTKGYYGKARYGYAYYDPATFREFLRATFVRLWIERKTLEQLRNDFEATKRTLRIHDATARHVFDRISLVLHAQRSCFILGYGVLGYSYLGKRSSEEAEVVFVDYDLQVRTARIKTLDHVQYGFILDVTPLNQGVLMERESIYRKPPRELPARFREFARHLGSPDLARFVERKVRRIMFTYRYTPLVFANYQRAEERADWRKSERADQWMELQLLRYEIEHLVDPVVRKYESNPVMIRAYKSAALQLVVAKVKRHRWGYRGFEAMTEDEFFRWWLDHWKAQGLKEEVLREIYERVKPWLSQLRLRKWELGRKLRETRYRLALLS